MSIVARRRSIIKPIVFSQDLLSKLADVPTPAGPTHPDDHSLPASLMSRPLAGGPPRLVRRENGISNYQCARARLQFCIYSKLVGSDHILVSFDLEKGPRREITSISNGGSHRCLSPDGLRLALVLEPH